MKMKKLLAAALSALIGERAVFPCWFGSALKLTGVDEFLAGLARYAPRPGYPEDFAAVKGVFEGLYIATPDTHVLTHTSQGAIGITTRSGDSLKSLQDSILSQHQLTNLGIMKSPGTSSMIEEMIIISCDASGTRQ